MSGPLPRVLRGPIPWILFFALATVLLVAGGVTYFSALYQRIEAEELNELTGIASSKVEQIVQWKKERLADARRSAASPFFVSAVEALLAAPADDALKGDWLARLRLEQEVYEYENVMLLDREGNLLLAADPEHISLHHPLEATMRSAIEKSTSVLSGLHADVTGKFHLDTFAPVQDSRGRLLAILILRSDPNQYLYPVLRSWATNSPTAETLLITWDEEAITFLSPLRHRPDVRPMHRLSRKRSDVIAVKAAAGARGLVHGRDYRNVRVTAAAHAIPGTDWVLVAKVDSAELLGEARSQALTVGLFVVLGIMLAGSTTALSYRRWAARENEIRSSILESAGEGIYGIDLQGQCTFINRAGADMLGASPENFLGLNMHNLIHHHHEDGREYPETDCPIFQAFREGRKCRIEQEVFWRLDGSRFDADYSSQPIAEGGAITGAVVTFRDVTQQRHAAEAIRESRAQLAHAQRIARLGSWVLDIPSGRLSWREEVYRIFGVPAETEVQSVDDFFAYVHPDDAERMRWEQERALRGECELDVEHRIVRPDGTIRHVHERGELVRDTEGRPLQLAGTVQDITERKQAEEALQRQSTLLEIAGEIAQFGGWALDLRENRLFWSDEVCAIHELPPGFAPGLEEALRFYAAEYRQTVEAQVRACIEEGQPFDYEAEIVTATGRRIWVRAGGIAEKDAAGTVVRIHGAFQDITERKLAELDVQRLANSLTTTLESITDAFFTLDREWRLTYLNRQAEHLMEQPREELLGRSIWEAFPAAVGTAFELEYRRAITENVTVEFEEFYQPLNRLFEVRAFPSREGLAVYFRDVTQRRKNEAAVRELDERLRGFLHHSPAMISEVDLNGRIRFVNRALAGLFNASAEDVVGKRIMDIIPESFARAFEERIQRIERERRPVTVEDAAPAETGERTFSTTLFPLFDANQEVTSVGSIGIEVTEQRRAQEALRESETLRLIASQVARLGGWRADLPSGVIISSDEMCAILEVPPGTKRTLGDALNDYAPESQEAVSRAFAAALGDGKPIDVEARLITATGKRVWVRTIGHALRNEKGEIIRLQGATQDITARKKEEAELEKLEAQLRQAQKMEAVGRLAGGIAHDYNNMLTVIQGYSQMALDDLEASSPLRMNVEEIMAAAKRSEDLTRQLLAFARQQTIAPRVLDLNDTISSMLKMLGRLIGENIELHWKPGANVGHVMMDPVQIDQILANLAVNARDAISDAGELIITTSVAELDEEYCEAQPELTPGVYALLTVSDTGHGMDRETTAQAFEPFFTTKDPGKGTGLGLSTVYGILKQNDGHITVYSELGKGTTFHIYLPRHQEETSSAMDVRRTEPLPRGNETLLLVEDEAALLNLTRRLLEELGYRVLTAGGPEQALDVIREAGDGVDLLVTDVVMPTMSGRDLWNKLATSRPDLKVLYMSGYTADVIAHHGVLHDGLVFLQKPFSKHSLASKIREALEKG